MPLPSGSPIADNDDALARDYWRVAERYAGAVVARQPDLDGFWISFPLGAQLAEGRFRLFSTKRSHFRSRVTAVAGAEGSRPRDRLWRQPSPSVRAVAARLPAADQRADVGGDGASA